jgi:hypothetical protein
MKNLILTLALAAFAVAAQAADSKPACKNSAQAGCCEKTCPMKAAAEAKSGCCTQGKTASKGKVSKPLMSPKAAEVASK